MGEMRHCQWAKDSEVQEPLCLEKNCPFFDASRALPRTELGSGHVRVSSRANLRAERPLKLDILQPDLHYYRNRARAILFCLRHLCSLHPKNYEPTQSCPPSLAILHEFLYDNRNYDRILERDPRQDRLLLQNPKTRLHGRWEQAISPRYSSRQDCNCRGCPCRSCPINEYLCNPRRSLGPRSNPRRIRDSDPQVDEPVQEAQEHYLGDCKATIEFLIYIETQL